MRTNSYEGRRRTRSSSRGAREPRDGAGRLLRHGRHRNSRPHPACALAGRRPGHRPAELAGTGGRSWAHGAGRRDSVTSLPEDVCDEPLRRYKLAVVRGTPPRLHPIGRYRRRSYEYLEPRRAVCHRRGHRAPAVDCTCGFHAVEQIDQLPRVTTVLAGSVVLAVDLGGTIIEHERGVRAEEQAVLGVGFPARCHRCGEQATVVVPGRLWRSAGAGRAARVGGPQLTRGGGASTSPTSRPDCADGASFAHSDCRCCRSRSWSCRSSATRRRQASRSPRPAPSRRSRSPSPP